ncbi:tyrosine--tRNA ligase [Mucilaginibacter sp. ZT4R22]|uniref:Tyrosine--tRNA ligase n=1 Tax=Mucilaginibacter pankratovii TaxID=2772110 RepID=A0ABR7WXL3_9SPHI|nr:tyrosine--tRNA ligase [Mucilaginibacter pankratovii]MBD1367028.1 tyrosine--tRNA ligase [Mucilaginibacter pankratovii]
MNFVEELRWRGMLHDIMPGTEELLNKGMVSGYIGFDPTADSLHVGSLAQIMTLIHFQRAGHKPFALVGGATGMVGDPSGKSAERNLLNEEDLQHNLNGIKGQLERFLDFETGDNAAQMVNNYDWFKGYDFLNFIRDVGKHITVNYMMAKDSVKNRINGDTGMSFTEFSYQLVQGYDFYYLWKNRNCALQMGGSDQWGNIVTGTELIRRKGRGEAFALTTQLIKKSDGTKFGKSEGGNIWLDAAKTKPFDFYQFWLNTSDEDAKAYIRIFTLFDQSKIESIEIEHNHNPGTRVLQKALAADITIRVHGEEKMKLVYITNDFAFNKDFKWEHLSLLSEQDFIDIFSSTKVFYNRSADVFLTTKYNNPTFSDEDIISFLSEIRDFDENLESKPMFESKSEIRKLIINGGIYINKTKVLLENKLSDFKAFRNQYLYVQKGKKNAALVVLCKYDSLTEKMKQVNSMMNR